MQHTDWQWHGPPLVWGRLNLQRYSDLSEIAGIFDITSSRHNRKLQPDKAICRIRENLHYEESTRCKLGHAAVELRSQLAELNGDTSRSVFVVPGPKP